MEIVDKNQQFIIFSPKTGSRVLGLLYCSARWALMLLFLSLHSKSGRDVVEIMQRLAKKQGCMILLVTHDTRILDVADRIVHMEDGRLARDTALVSSIV